MGPVSSVQPNIVAFLNPALCPNTKRDEQILLGLEIMHRESFAHRDLKLQAFSPDGKMMASASGIQLSICS